MRLKTLRAEIKRCRQCSLRRGCLQVIPDNKMFFDAKEPVLMIVGYHPSAHDELLDEAFSKDLHGNFLKNVLKHAGLIPRDIFMTHLIKCRPVIEEITDEHLQTCKHWLWKQILDIKPKVIVTLGLEVSNFVLKKNRKMGDMIGKFYVLPKTSSFIAPWYSLEYTTGRPKVVDEMITFFKKVKERL